MNRNRQILISVGILLFLIAGLFSSCYYDSREELFGNTGCDTTAVSYADQILPIIENNCLLCHSVATAPIVGGDVTLEGYDNLMGYVVAGDPENSLFYASVAWLTGAVPMPRPEGSSQLSDCELSLIRSWIISGATNN
jgi:hypothetical protein